MKAFNLILACEHCKCGCGNGCKGHCGCKEQTCKSCGHQGQPNQP